MVGNKRMSPPQKLNEQPSDKRKRIKQDQIDLVSSESQEPEKPPTIDKLVHPAESEVEEETVQGFGALSMTQLAPTITKAS